ncbi:MAG: hypothetical protein A3G32_01915 [Deltaproteobacteria bacterium RIFCSPLOWO2_12_FULL_40_28]|nr:MAG: hypothetical protein A3C45_06660 [Deltaproteobacteria bacterium RIFCSPHIGHO2_02_FULL_40_28]OGQ18887.1 MAG: hypothetical protein A3E27_09295 [Deltaproteobacteria bacterium RIFCSPHIGHO2_12_FULL_40_32]OGQ40132.1 MAG: hypothetical protein A3I69_01825 [Deltaproteobacteria bacterium RIFCSPLOWO2_02_FULL_40_36]OGQ53315.1 MAG: hypothetical protein A3G32_01915 [Deltaproteobacteria bacterium RIFCSPLOWO2_12_FULL_40_28]
MRQKKKEEFMKRARKKEITDYDSHDTTAWINLSQKKKLDDLGFMLPPIPPTQVVSIRLPTRLLNQIKAKASQQDVPYQALIKLALGRFLDR